jgi:hypothetical protein
MAWGELIDELEEQRQGLQSYVKRIDDKQVIEEAIRPALSAYLRSFFPLQGEATIDLFRAGHSKVSLIVRKRREHTRG